MREPADLGVVVGRIGHHPELSTHALGREDARHPEHIGQRLEGRANDPEHEVGLVDQLAVAVFEDTPEVGDHQVVAGALGAIEKRIRLEHAEGRLTGITLAVTLGELGMRRQGQDVGLPVGRFRELADRGRSRQIRWLQAADSAAGSRPEAQPDGARDPGGVEDEDANPLLRPFDRADPSPGGDERRDLDRQRRLADAAGEAEDTDEAQPRAGHGESRRAISHRTVPIGTVVRRVLVAIASDETESDGLIPIGACSWTRAAEPFLSCSRSRRNAKSVDCRIHDSALIDCGPHRVHVAD